MGAGAIRVRLTPGGIPFSFPNSPKTFYKTNFVSLFQQILEALVQISDTTYPEHFAETAKHRSAIAIIANEGEPGRIEDGRATSDFLCKVIQNQAQFVAHIDEDRQRFTRIERDLQAAHKV